jgi:hypothetical protein
LGILGPEQMGAVGTVFETKENSMKWLKRLIYRWNQEGRELWDEDDSLIPMTKSSRNRAILRSNSLGSSDVDSDDGLNITVRKAIGGKIVTFRHYDHKTDRSNHKLYIIPDDLEFDRELGKMITLESLRL